MEVVRKVLLSRTLVPEFLRRQIPANLKVFSTTATQSKSQPTERLFKAIKITQCSQPGIDLFKNTKPKCEKLVQSSQ